MIGDVLSKFVTETKPNVNFIQVGLPTSASAQDAATYQFVVPPNQPNKVIDTQSIESYLTSIWGATNNIGQPTNCTNGCVASSKFHGNRPVHLFRNDRQGAASTINLKQFVGIALYQINQPNVLFNACKQPSAKHCPDGTLKPPQGVSYPETVSPKAWNAFISWLNGETQMKDALDICK